LRDHKDLVAVFVTVSQRAFEACAKEPQPCIEALVEANKGLQVDNELTNWGLVKELMTDETSTTKGLGYMDEARMQASYELFEPFLDKPFDITQRYTNEFVDTSIKMPTN
jgi:NitT/TauT family transport system substrate-binding protein